MIVTEGNYVAKIDEHTAILREYFSLFGYYFSLYWMETLFSKYRVYIPQTFRGRD